MVAAVLVLGFGLGLLSQAAPPQAKDQGSHHERQGSRWPLKWWSDKEVAAILKLSSQQRTQLDQMFNAWAISQRVVLSELTEANDAVDTLLAQPTLDLHACQKAIERAERLKYAVSKSRSLFLFSLLQFLAPEQRVKLLENARRGPPGKEGTPRE